MKGWILYHKTEADLTEDNHCVNRLLQESRKEGINMSVCTPQQFELIVSRTDKNSILLNEQITDLPDFVIHRMGSYTPYFALAVLRKLESLNVATFNSSSTIRNVIDKLYVHQMLAESNLPTPKTMLLKTAVNMELIQQEIGFPLIVKNITGTLGKGVFLCENKEKFQDLIELMYSYNKNINIIIQEFVSYKKGEDLRVFVCGGKVIGSMRRIAQDGRFKANFSCGAAVEKFEMNEEIEYLALETAKLMNLQIAGIDILFDTKGYKVLEANSSPQFQGLELATGKNIAKDIIHFIKASTLLKNKK